MLSVNSSFIFYSEGNIHHSTIVEMIWQPISVGPYLKLIFNVFNDFPHNAQFANMNYEIKAVH